MWLFRNFAKRYFPEKGSKGIAKAKRPYADFIGTTTHSLQRWLSGGAIPRGLELIKLRFLLEADGCRVLIHDQLRTKAPVLYKLAELLAFGAITASQAKEALGFANENGVFRLAHGGCFTTAARARKIEELYSQHEKEVREGWQELAKLVSKSVRKTLAGTPKEETIQSSISTPDSKLELNTDDSLAHVAYLILALLPFAEKVASDDFDKEARVQLRQMTGEVNAIPRLTDALIKLSGETARKHVVAKTNGGN